MKNNILLQDPIHNIDSIHKPLTRSSSLDDLVQQARPRSEAAADQELGHAKSSNELQRYNKDLAWSRGECAGFTGSRKLSSVVGDNILLNLLETVDLLV